VTDQSPKIPQDPLSKSARKKNAGRDPYFFVVFLPVFLRTSRKVNRFSEWRTKEPHQMSGCSQTQVERDAHLALDNQQQETMRLLSQPHAEVRDLGQLLPSEDAIQILTSLRDSSSTVAHYLQMQFVDSVNDE